MEIKKKLEMLEDLMELDAGVLSEQTVLTDLDEWDSVTILSVIVLIEDEFNKSVKGTDIKACQTVLDVLKLMGD